MLKPLVKIGVSVMAGAGLMACQPKAPPALVLPLPVQAEADEPKPAPVVIAKAPTTPATIERQITRSNMADAPKFLTVSAEEIPAVPTRILHRASAERLFGNSGLTLQWIDWDKRGQVWIAVDEEGVWWLTGSQIGEAGVSVELGGLITEIGADYFILDGEITIDSAPDAGRFCDANKQWRFAVTQNRKYWRLREFEWCDGLTDYIDIYF
ncbi:MAG: hypothetical protein ABJP34_05065 [Erythrobacter sp.]